MNFGGGLDGPLRCLPPGFDCAGKAGARKVRARFSRPRPRTTWRSSVVAILLGIAVCCASASAAAGGEQWGWFLAESGIDKWLVLQGKATVTVAGGRFTAELYNHAGDHIATLAGQERNGVVDVKVERHGTDDLIRHMRGERQTTEFRAERRRRQSILFREPGQLPAVVIGLTHDTAIR